MNSFAPHFLLLCVWERDTVWAWGGCKYLNLFFFLPKLRRLTVSRFQKAGIKGRPVTLWGFKGLKGRRADASTLHPPSPHPLVAAPPPRCSGLIKQRLSLKLRFRAPHRATGGSDPKLRAVRRAASEPSRLPNKLLSQTLRCLLPAGQTFGERAVTKFSSEAKNLKWQLLSGSFSILLNYEADEKVFKICSVVFFF